MSASVKIMLSFDYCHFEIMKGTDEELTNEQINKMRKDVQRLADEAVRQYRKAKERAAARNGYEKQRFDATIKEILLKPENTLSLEETAMLKLYRDEQWQKQFELYDYEDDYEDDKEINNG